MPSNPPQAIADVIRIERFIADMTHEAIKRQALPDFLASTVERLGRMLEVSRSSFLEYDLRRRAVTATHEWLAGEAASAPRGFQGVRFEEIPWITDELLSGEVLRLEEARAAPSPALRAFLESRKVHSLLVVPVCAFGAAFGCAAFEECRRPRPWGDVDVELLKAAGRIIATTVERRRLEAEILRAERLAATGRLAASIAHEINNPLQGITLHLEAIRDHIDRKRQRNLDFVMEGLGRITRIIRRLLDIRSDVKKAEAVNVNALAQEAFRIVANQLSIKGGEVRWRLAADLPLICGSADQLQQVFVNLLLNAVDSMEGGGTLTIATRREGDREVVEIEDTGGGIDEERLPFLFEPFFSTKERAGTGLGLFVSHAIVADHGGRIEVRSRKGEGTTMRVLLPIGCSAPAANHHS